MRDHELTDAQWARLAPLLPPQRPRTGRPAKDHRTVLNGILWILRTGAPWWDLPERYGSWSTVASRFRRWRDAGIWDQVLRTRQAEAAHDQGNRIIERYHRGSTRLSPQEPPNGPST